MTHRFAIVPALLVLLLAPAASPFSARPHAQVSASCSQELGGQEAALRQFNADAKKEALDFAVNDAREAALSGMRKNLEGDPTADALAEMQQKYEDWQEFLERGKTFEAMMADLSRCLTLGAGGCLNEIMAKARESARLLGIANDQFTNWIKSLGNDTISKAVERVEKARSVMQNLGRRAGNMAMDATKGALKNCFEDMQRRVEARKDQVDLRTQLPPKPPTPGNGGSGGGPSVGKAIGVVAAGTAATAGALIVVPKLLKSASGPDCSPQLATLDNTVSSLVSIANTNCGTNLSCLDSVISRANNAIATVIAAAGNVCACTGATPIDAQAKAEVRELFAALRDGGFSTGNLPGCFR
jgi:hypothetical protein